MSVAVSGPDSCWRIEIKTRRAVEVFCKLQRRIKMTQVKFTSTRTRGDALIRSQASSYKTEGEFLENSSEVKQ
jgi:hypothetical protein